MRPLPPTLGDLLGAPGHTLLDPADLLDLLLAATPEATAAHAEALAQSLGRRGSPSVESVLAAWRSHIDRLLPVPAPPATRRGDWLDAFITLDRALVNLRALLDVPRLAALAPWGHECAAVLSRRLDAARAALRARDDAWLDAGTVHGVPSGAASGAFEGAPDATGEVFERWGAGRLHPDDDAALARLVGAAGPWQDAFRAWVRRRAREVYAVAWDADLVPGVATSERDGAAMEWLRVPLPYLRAVADDPALVVRAHREGTLWQLPSPEGVARIVVPFDAPSHVWGDAVVGEIRTSITVRVPTAREQRERAVAGVVSAAYDDARPVPPQALALAKDLARDPLVSQLAAGARAFQGGDEGVTVNEATAWAALALRARIALDILAARDDGRLLDALIDVDAALAPHADALLLLDEPTWQEITEHEPLDADTWWGRRAGLPALPQVVREERAPAPVVSLASRRARAPRVEVQRLSVAAAAEDRRPPHGFVAEVLLPVVDPTGAGRVARLRVWHEPHRGLRGTDTRFRLAAGEALHDAFVAAEFVCRQRARYPWEDHAVVVELVDGDDRALDVDGRSLGLAAMLAFVSCWSERVPSDGVAASARVVERAVAPIDHVDRKRDALSQRFGDAFTLLVHPDDAAAGDARVRPVATLHDALAAAGLPTPVPTFEPVEGTVAQRSEELSRLARCVETQQVTTFEGLGVEPWRLLAERLAWLCDSLDHDDPTASVDRARVLAALAFVHAGDTNAADAELAKVPENDDPAVALLRAIVKLTHEVDVQEFRDARARDWTGAEALSARIDAMLPAVAGRERRLLRGQALGTQGRALLHARRFEEAIAKLDAAYGHHRDELAREALRSSVTRSMALREAGRPLDALAALDAGREHLGACRGFSRDYAEGCEMFWCYERGRVLLVLGETDAARDELVAALEESRSRGWWPRLGILRVLAWLDALDALDALEGDEVARAARLDEMTRATAGLPAYTSGFVARMIAEARGDWHDGREVY